MASGGVGQAELVTALRALQVMPFWQTMQAINRIKRTPWDPEESEDWVNQAPNSKAIRRIKQDVYKTVPPSGCYVEPDDEDFTLVHVLVKGPEGTPYEGGFFYFLVRFPPDYPLRSPRVKLMTTRNNRVRFNPNLYKDGKVCLSILGTWHNGPSWTPAHCLFTILEAILGVMHKEPYYNEPDLMVYGLVPGRSERYNDFLYYETIRSAVCEMIENLYPRLPESLRSTIEKLFLEKFDFYMNRIEKKKHLDSQTMMVDTYGREDGTFNFAGLKKRLEKIHSSFKECEERRNGTAV